jgi:hypothetical protein
MLWKSAHQWCSQSRQRHNALRGRAIREVHLLPIKPFAASRPGKRSTEDGPTCTSPHHALGGRPEINLRPHSARRPCRLALQHWTKPSASAGTRTCSRSPPDIKVKAFWMKSVHIERTAFPSLHPASPQAGSNPRSPRSGSWRWCC